MEKINQNQKLYDPDKVEQMPRIILRLPSRINAMGGELVEQFRNITVAVMRVPPEVMVWGERTFVYRGVHGLRGDLVYVEALAYPIVPGITAEIVHEESITKPEQAAAIEKEIQVKADE